MLADDPILAQPRTGAATPPPEQTSVPPLREDIRIVSTGRRAGGAPAFVLHDPAANAFYQIGWMEFEVLSRWGLGTPAAILAGIGRETALTISEASIRSVARFLEVNGLVRVESARILKRVREAAARKSGSPGIWLSENLLFRKIPVVRPRRFLAATLPLIAPLFSRGFAIGFAVFALITAYLVGRDVDALLASLGAFFSVEGFAGITAALVIGKGAHELGHAYAATRHGVDVPSLGVSLIMGWPVLYTDTTAAWALPRHSQRLEIALAGVAVEAVLATVALFAWVFADPGPVRNTLLFAGTSMVALSLALNLNPFMRFDGYYALSELMGIDNLQPRAVGAVRAVLRRLFTGAEVPDPEPSIPRAIRLPFLGYGFGTLVYRVTLYCGIAYGLWLTAFAPIALPVGAVLIGTFLLKPVALETASYFKAASSAWGRIAGPLRVLLLFAPLIAVLFIPWSGTVVAPVVYRAGEVVALYAPEGARVDRVAARDGDPVIAGDILMRLSSPELDNRLTAVILQQRALVHALARDRAAAARLSQAIVEQHEQSRLAATIDGLLERRARLDVSAGAAGVIGTVDPGLEPGRWVGADQPLLTIITGDPARVTAYVEERDIPRIAAGARVTIWLDGVPLRSFAATVASIATEATEALTEPVLAAPNGGPIAIRDDGHGKQRPELALYQVQLTLDSGEAALPRLETRGFAHIRTAPRALAWRLLDRVLGVIRREFG